MSERSVVVTGIGLICPLGHDTPTITENLRELRHNFHHKPEFAEFKRSRVRVGTTIPGFDTCSPMAEDWSCPYPAKVSKDILRGFNPHSYYGYHATTHALHEAGLGTDEFGPETGLFTASAGSASNLHRNLDRMHAEGVGRADPFGIISSVVGTLSWNLSAIFGIRGAGCGFASACASSAHALGFAHDQIALDRQERMLVVGAEDGDLESILPFGGIHALSTAEDPDSASLPFDTRRKGFVGCGGAAAFVLESAESAERRKAGILARFTGWGQASDGYRPAAPRPDGLGLANAMRIALKASGTEEKAVDYLNAHATGTQVGDIAEARAIREVFGNEPPFPVSSTKSLTGHGLSLAGAMEAALSIRALREGFVPATANLREPDPDCEGLWLPRETLGRQAHTFLSNSCGFGGANVCLVFDIPDVT